MRWLAKNNGLLFDMSVTSLTLGIAIVVQDVPMGHRSTSSTLLYRHSLSMNEPSALVGLDLPLWKWSSILQGVYTPRTAQAPPLHEHWSLQRSFLTSCHAKATPFPCVSAALPLHP